MPGGPERVGMMMRAQDDDITHDRSSGDLVLPGDRVGRAGPLRTGNGVMAEEGDLIATQMGILIRSDRSVHVIPMKGRYLPGKGDFLIGIVKDHTPSRWFFDISTPQGARLHTSDTPWTVDFGRTGEYMNVGDVAYLKVKEVDDIGRVDLTMKGPGLRKLSSGQVMAIMPSLVPRVIGRNGSLIAAVKRSTGCRIFMGKNGWIWVDGEAAGIETVRRVLDAVVERPHVGGVSERVLEILGEDGGA